VQLPSVTVSGQTINWLIYGRSSSEDHLPSGEPVGSPVFIGCDGMGGDGQFKSNENRYIDNSLSVADGGI